MSMKISDIFEAGEPSNPSRRDFLKKSAAVGATAATNPSGLLKGTGQAAKSVAGPLVTALAKPAALEARLVAACAAFAAKNMGSIQISDDDGDLGLEPDDFVDWKPGKNDVGLSYSDPGATSIARANGKMPWGQSYDIQLTPNGLPYLHSSTDGAYNGLLTYMDKDGNIKTKEYHNEGSGYGGDVDTATGEEIDDYGDFIDRLENLPAANKPEFAEPKNVIPEPKPEPAAAQELPAAANDIAGNLSKRAMIANLGKQVINKFTNKDKPTATDTSNLPHAGGIDKTQALPAPDKPNELFTTDLQRMKDLAGVKRNKN